MSTLPERIEQAHRKQLIVDTKRASALGKSVSQFRTDRANAIDKWTHSIRNIMKEHGVSDPVECLPAIVASVLEHAVVAARDEAQTTARLEIQRLLRKAIT
jgi:hypothetical protein